MKWFLSFFILLFSVASFANDVYLAPNHEFSVVSPYSNPYIVDNFKEPHSENILQFVDFYYTKYYHDEGLQTLEWINPKGQAFALLLSYTKNNFSGKKGNGYFLLLLRSKENKLDLKPTGNIHCTSKFVNKYPSYQCSEWVTFQDNNQPILFTLTIINFNKRIGVASGVRDNVETHNRFIESIKPLIF